MSYSFHLCASWIWRRIALAAVWFRCTIASRKQLDRAKAGEFRELCFQSLFGMILCLVIFGKIASSFIISLERKSS